MSVTFGNVYDIQIVLPDAAGFLSALTHSNTRVMHLKIIDELTIRMQVEGVCLSAVKALVLRYGGKLEILSQGGWRSFAIRIFSRYCLLIGLLILLILTIYIPTRILFVTVEGNEAVSATKILDVADRCGLSFGVARRDLRSEKVKNAMLQSMPELRWAGINTNGCCAVISVKERQYPDEIEPKNTVQGIYAVRDGIISDLTVLKGSALCKPGQAVHKGQLLISGYTDCNTVIRAERAGGEVFALTQHQLQGVYFRSPKIKEFPSERITGLKLIFGKKYVNINIGSGNYEPRCGKLYKKMDLTLPGGFQLPCSLVVETSLDYEIACDTVAGEPPEMLKELTRAYLSNVMLAGQILTKEESISTADHLWIIDGTYTCKEMIGRLQKEEIRIFED